MPTRFAVLASGSSGNASLIQVDGHVTLIDFGVGPRKLEASLETVGLGWDDIRSVLLTHVHGDHCNSATLCQLVKRGIPLGCHHHHLRHLSACNPLLRDHDQAGLVKPYEAHQPLDVGPCVVTPLPVWHDVPTFGFRIEMPNGAAIGYAADLGGWAAGLVIRLADVDLLALEFNHDVAMQLASRRHAQLIQRVLGDEGHLSNAQAARFLKEILQRSAPGRLRQVVPLHLSRDCNEPELVTQAIEGVRDDAGFAVHVASPDCPSPWFDVVSPIVRPLVRGKGMKRPPSPQSWPLFANLSEISASE